MAMRLQSLRERLVHRGAENFRNYADLAADHEERVWSSKGTDNRVIRMPAGPAVIITPWNAPWMLSTWKIAPALAAGNTVVLKPAEWSPVVRLDPRRPVGRGRACPRACSTSCRASARRSARRWSPTPGSGGSRSPARPRRRGTSAARRPSNIVPFTAELGGKGPLLVFEDADLDAAAKKAAVAVRRLRAGLPGRHAVARAGVDPRRVPRALPRPRRHPRPRRQPRRRDHDHADDPPRPPRPASTRSSSGRVQAGDRIVRGGRIVAERRAVLRAHAGRTRLQRQRDRPTRGVRPGADLPDLRRRGRGVRLANSTDYGLSAIVYTTSRERAERVGRAVRAGTVWVNTFLVRDLTAPFGGCRISGIGREGGDFALEFHADLKTLQILDGSTT